MVRIQLLGPVRAWRDGQELDLGGPKQRAVLALLATGAADGHATSRAQLVDALWPAQPPASAENVIQTYLKHLRRVLEPGRPPRAPGQLLQRVTGGYTLELSHVDVDVVVFRRLVAAAAEADRTGDRAGAAQRLREALRLWRGTPLANLDFLTNQPIVTALSAQRWAAVARYGEAQLATGNAAEALPVLEEATAARPLDEAAHARLIRAYHAAGDRAQAFATYQIIRRRLAEELGVDPGHELAAAHGTLLAEDRERSEVHRSVVPRQLPAPPRRSPAGRPSWPSSTRSSMPPLWWSPRSMAWRGLGRPPWRCTPRTGSPATTRTGSCSSTCTAIRPA